MSSSDQGQETSGQEALSRRAAAKRLAKYAAYTAPAMAVLLDSNDAQAWPGRGKRKGWWKKGRKKWRGPKPS